MLKLFREALLTVMLLLFCANAQGIVVTGTIKGKVLSSDGQPAEGVSIIAKDTKFMTITSEEGYFELKLPAGNYEIIFSYIGIKPVHRQVQVTAGKTTALSVVTLDQSAAQLQEITVNSARQNKFYKKESPYVAKMPLENLKNPQVYATISKELMVEQVTTDFAGAMRNAPGAAPGARVDNGRNVYMLRGFAESGYIRNGITSPLYMDIDPANLERVEVIKGPSGTLYGSSLISYGGLVNRVTKRPFKAFGGEVSYTNGGFGLNRFTADLNTPVNKDSSLLLRINAAAHREESFQDYGYAHNYLVNPVISYKVNDRTTIILEAEYYHRNATQVPLYNIISGSGVTDVRQLNSIYKRSFFTNEAYMEGGAVSYYGQINYRINDNWTSQTNVSWANNKYDRLAFTPYVMNDSMIQRRTGKINYDTKAMDIQQNFTGNFYTGSIRHRVLLGLDVLQRQYFLYNNASKGIYDTVNFRKAATPYVNREQLLAVAKGLAVSPSANKTNVYAAYASDVIELTSRLDVMLSLRYDYYDNRGSYKSTTGATTGAYHQGAWSPKLGIVYQVVKDQLSLFANYMNGFTNQTGEDANGKAFKPEQANQWEGGIKAELFEKKLTASISYYDIEVKNVLRTNLEQPDFSIQDGTQRSKGAEIEMIATPARGLNFVAGYGYNDSRYTAADADIEGHRPANVPFNVANCWVSYTLQQGAAAGLGAGLGANYYGQTFYDDANSLNVPAATILNASVFYNRSRYRIALKADNLTDKRYWLSLSPQMPLRISGSLALKF
ncbi:MAG: TonB-dependent siderophore receptor [Bacteroidetes bacterium]|uniref:TonB-dependent receptor n=1 Tax=unclassified Chitinophaga TaxID=2619133 RepID=UPI0009C46E01|nr:MULTISPECIES: TonB-dependent receptor [unclassified Chitinophaga]MBP1649871.1 TonB-dependent siderophore receptor [Bacteroidota bacterium]OMP79260.1 hypothetical protein BW716_10400 [[Flexibacter] sp. ATCC 35208]WPV63785.1 TonB-dependent receptor [Chitinophaga sp. LS1]